MFALVSWNTVPLRLSLKCEPFHAQALRSMFDSIIPGYHLNKDHWNTIILDGSIPVSLIKKMIDDSYSLVVRSLTKAERNKLNRMP